MALSELATPNANQIKTWNEKSGPTWVKYREQLDAQIRELGLAALDRLSPKPGERILDIGCGCGDTVLQLAAAVGDTGHVTGIDISRPMLEVAQHRAEQQGFTNITFKELDAQEAPLPNAGYDALYSRFGVMFFDDPEKAFRNLHASLRPGGRLAFVCWRTIQENPWMLEPFKAAQSVLPPIPASDPLAPGPYALANPDRLERLLHQADFRHTTIERYDTWVGGQSLDDATQLSLKVGPLGTVLRENPHYLDSVTDVVRLALQPYNTDSGVQMRAGVWLVTASQG